MVDPGEGPGAPLIFGPNWGPKCQKILGRETGLPLTKGLDDHLPPLSQGSGFGTEAPLPCRPTDLPKMYGCASGCSLFQQESFGEKPWGSCGYQSKIFTKVNFPMKVTSSGSLKESCLLIIFSYSTWRCYSHQENCVQMKYLWSVTCIVLQEKANQVWETKPQARTTTTTTTTTTLFVPYIDLHDTKKNYYEMWREYRLPIITIED